MNTLAIISSLVCIAAFASGTSVINTQDSQLEIRNRIVAFFKVKIPFKLGARIPIVPPGSIEDPLTLSPIEITEDDIPGITLSITDAKMHGLSENVDDLALNQRGNDFTLTMSSTVMLSRLEGNYNLVTSSEDFVATGDGDFSLHFTGARFSLTARFTVNTATDIARVTSLDFDLGFHELTVSAQNLVVNGQLITDWTKFSAEIKIMFDDFVKNLREPSEIEGLKDLLNGVLAEIKWSTIAEQLKEYITVSLSTQMTSGTTGALLLVAMMSTLFKFWY